jgi:hypothetical protein
MISLYYATTTFVRIKGSNVDSEERLRVLTTFKDWLKNGYTKKKKENAEFKKFVKDILFKEMITSIEATNNVENGLTSDNIVYHIGGYLIKKFKKKSSCAICLTSFECTDVRNLPQGFNAHHLTDGKNRGRLQMSSYKLFQLLASIETDILDYCSNGDIMKNDSFLDILYSLCLEELPQVGCDDHRQEVMVNLIYDFMVTRLKCVACNSKRESLEKKELLVIQRKNKASCNHLI